MVDFWLKSTVVAECVEYERFLFYSVMCPAFWAEGLVYETVAASILECTDTIVGDITIIWEWNDGMSTSLLLT